MVLRERRRTNNSILLLLAALATIAALAILRAVLEPLAIALFMSFVAMPFVRTGRRMRIPGPLLVGGIILFLLFSCGWVMSLVFQSLADFLIHVPEYEEQLRPIVARVFERLDISTEILPPPGEGIPWKTIFTSTPIAGYAGSSLGGFLGWAGELLVVLTFLIFILMDRTDGALERRIVHAFVQSGSREDQIRPILQEITRDIERYILVKAGISLFTGFVVTTLLHWYGVRFAVLFGAVAFVLNFIPNIGSVIASVPPIVVAFVQFGSVVKVLPLALLLLLIQGGVGNFLDPWMMGKSLRLSPTTVLFCLILWNWLWGIPGMVLAVPIAVIARIILLRVPDLRYLAVIMSDAEVAEHEISTSGSSGALHELWDPNELAQAGPEGPARPVLLAEATTPEPAGEVEGAAEDDASGEPVAEPPR